MLAAGTSVRLHDNGVDDAGTIHSLTSSLTFSSQALMQSLVGWHACFPMQAFLKRSDAA